MVSFANRQVGAGHPCFVTFEAGPTHNGLESAKRLISFAAEAGGDAVKFQMLDPDRLVADRSVEFEFEILINKKSGETKKVKEPLYDLFVRRSLTRDEWRALKKHADEVGVAFFATAGFHDEIEFLEELGCHSIKIASSDVNHFPLIRHAAQTGMCVQLDTGNSTIGEVEAAIDVIRSEGNENIIIHHCPSGYPAKHDGINLNILTSLQQMFDYPIAFSDHSPGWEMDVAAIALGASLVEKTISEDRMTPSVEHIFSLEPSDMKKFVETVQMVQTALGVKRRIMTPEEIDKRRAMRRSGYLLSPAKRGDRIRDLDIEYRRPGFGLGPSDLENFADRVLAKDLEVGDRLEFEDLA